MEWSLSTPDGKRLVDRKETTDDQGRLTMIVPADMDLPTRSHGPAQLTVTAGGGANPPSVALPLPIRPARYLTRLWLDRRSYRAGETVYYRSLTVSRYSLVAHRTLPVEFEILDPKSVPLPDSRIDGLTDHGVGNGSFRLSDSLPAGAYTLVARGLDDVFPEERLAFEVIGPRRAATSKPPTNPRPIPARTGNPARRLLSRGRTFGRRDRESASTLPPADANGQPLEIRGNIVDGKGASVARGSSPRRPWGIQHRARRRGNLPAEDYQPGGSANRRCCRRHLRSRRSRSRRGGASLPPGPAGVHRPRGEGPSSAGHHGPRARHARGSADARHFVVRSAGEGQRGVDSLG